MSEVLLPLTEISEVTSPVIVPVPIVVVPFRLNVLLFKTNEPAVNVAVPPIDTLPSIVLLPLPDIVRL